MPDSVPEPIAEKIYEPTLASPIAEDVEELELSNYTTALLDALKSIREKPAPDDLSKLSVSQTVSFLAIAYEKLRNAVEYREDHLVLRAAIERILKRRLALNPEGTGEAENLLRELTWARYFPNESLGDRDIDSIQKIINRYNKIKAHLLSRSAQKTHITLFQHLFEFLTCEIEETLDPTATIRFASFTYFIFQVLKDRVRIVGLDEQKKNAYLLVALDRTYRKSDLPYLRYHLFTTFYTPLTQLSDDQLEKILPDLSAILKKIDEMIVNPHVDSLSKFIKKQLPPFLIFFDLINKKGKELLTILKDKNVLQHEVEELCREKYKQVGSRLRNLAFRSLIYIFVTKMLLALILEYPVSQFLYNEVNTTSILINTIFPPVLMLAIVLFFKLPGEDNTKKIFNRIINIIDKEKAIDTQVSAIKKRGDKKSLRVFIFTVVYSLTFLLTLYLIHYGLNLLHFNVVSQAIFIFFISVVSFFSYRVKQVTNEYKIDEREGFLGPIVDFFFLPILALGKFFSREIGRLNVFIIFFDFIIEAPFKMIIDVFEEWIKFVRARKDEIV